MRAYLELDHFSLMGFSFGAVLTLKSLLRLEERVDQLVLVSPVLSKRALIFSAVRHRLLQFFINVFKIAWIRQIFLGLISNKLVSQGIGRVVKLFGQVEENVDMRKVFAKITPDLLKTMTYQFDEILSFEFSLGKRKFNMPTYFLMSVNDTMIDFETTLDAAKDLFDDLWVKEFDFPYHQPPRTPSFEEFLDLFHEVLEAQE